MLRQVILLIFLIGNFATNDVDKLQKASLDPDRKKCSNDVPLNIDIWYGEHQRFGHLGMPQRWINILGNISPVDSISKCFYILNNRSAQSFNLGPDLHRLAHLGDFNLDLPVSVFEKGTNQLIITAISGTQIISDTVFLEVEKGVKSSLPYEVDFSEVDHLQDVAQVVDGHWLLVEDGVRTKKPYYDRVLCFGDSSWQNYEALVKLTIHDWTPSAPGPPTYNVTHFGVALHWRGHHEDERQPRRKWYPLGAQGEFLLKEEADSCQWRILLDGQVKEKPPVFAPSYNTVKRNTAIWVKAQVKSLQKGKNQYRFKQWQVGQEEPLHWNVQGVEEFDYASGSLCLVPHNSDVTIHTISINPIS